MDYVVVNTFVRLFVTSDSHLNISVFAVTLNWICLTRDTYLSAVILTWTCLTRDTHLSVCSDPDLDMFNT